MLRARESLNCSTSQRYVLLLGCVLAVGCKSTTPPAATTAGASAAPSGSGTSAVISGTGGGSKVGVGGGGAAVNAGPGGTGAPSSGTTGAQSGSGVAQSGTTGGPKAGTSTGPSAGTNAPVGVPVGGDTSVLQYHNHANRDGLYTQPAFTRAAAAKIHRDTAFTAMVSGPTYAQPLYFENGPGGKDIVIVATEQNEVSAFDAASGAMVWRKTLGPASAKGGGPGGCPLAMIDPLGITGTPVIDAASKTLFLDAMVSNNHQIFALNLDNGETKAGWPVDVSTVKAGSLSFNAPAHNQRGALLVLNGMVYVPYGGHYGDCGDYRGWVVGVPMDNPKAPIGWATRASAGGVWAPSGIASDGKSVWIATGNTMAMPSGSFPSFTTPSMWGDGEAIIRLPVDLKFTADNKDFFTPQNWASLDTSDFDVGGSGVVLFSVPGATPSEVALALGKDGSAYLANRENLGAMGGQLGMPTKVSSEPIMQATVAYNTPTGTFVTMRARGSSCPSGMGSLTALKVSAESPPKVSAAWCGAATSTGSPMVTTTDGMSESIVWLVAGTKLVGLNGETGAEVFNGGAAGDAVSAAAKWQTPIAAKGRIYFASNNQLYAFTL
jgi:hypothetical protein